MENTHTFISQRPIKFADYPNNVLYSKISNLGSHVAQLLCPHIPPQSGTFLSLS